MEFLHQVEEISSKAMDHQRKCWVRFIPYVSTLQPNSILEMGSFLHACEGEIVCESNNPKIPYFNAPIYLENKVSMIFHGGIGTRPNTRYRLRLAKWTKF